MRPVVPEEVGDLLKSRPVMIFNRTLLGSAYIESIVSSSPALVTSQGGKALPLEVWDMIIDFSNRCPENHRYSLVRPKRLQTSARGDELVCDMYKRWWWPFGDTYCRKGIEMLRFYLAHPDEPSESDHPDLNSIRLSSFFYTFPHFVESPFAISSLFPFDGYFDLSEYLDFLDKYVSSCAFPAALLASKTKFLHVDLTISDVIKNLEDGNCECCHGKHVIGSDFEGRCGPDWSMFWHLLDEPISYDIIGFFICPLCVGPEYARESIKMCASTCPEEYYRESPTKCKDPTQGPKATGLMFCITSLSQKKYKSWLLDRVESLGFKRPRWEDIPHSEEQFYRRISSTGSGTS